MASDRMKIEERNGIPRIAMKISLRAWVLRASKFVLAHARSLCQPDGVCSGAIVFLLYGELFRGSVDACFLLFGRNSS